MGIIQGQMDTQLNEAGIAQAELTGKSLKDVNFVKAYSSDSSRAADTARAILAYHPDCELVLDPRIRERNMGSLSGTKAPVRRPLPSGVETSESVGERLLEFWKTTIIPLCSSPDPLLNEVEDLNTNSDVVSSTESPTRSVDPQKVHTPAILIVSHGATISKLISQVFLQNYGYKVSCEIRRAIYNTSISILRMTSIATGRRPISDNDRNLAEENKQSLDSVSGELITCASISHLTRKKDIVEENADLLGQGSL
ncbi:putative fructose-2,6-bisphosphatase TIGAR A OS=Danio rerio GN=tigara PE=2 SV=1 [Rhizoctonia solani AG-1 IB]|uniref:Putative fructose-2,6-bisphosphatase TIGAR A n=1 Tax=Thanatephorus cucumeris (strain AG1-IB / isolate 7/3/14) TaxID=1108050 RepID=A0A0B7G5Q3_THACB|nr:putative fructose-2,6-bisphosphatase TIGAR A OS=Danio rerio GN=tigara PE=2 SV=1 [Rhizoctonia solani AG-1 IB]